MEFGTIDLRNELVGDIDKDVFALLEEIIFASLVILSPVQYRLNSRRDLVTKS